MKVLTKIGQIKKGDKLLINYKGNDIKYTAKKVLNESLDDEQIIININKNKYFIVEMAIDGTSWAKFVRILDEDE